MAEFDVDLAACRGRQQRLLAETRKLGIELLVVNQREHVQWLTGTHVGPMFHCAAALWADGHMAAVLPGRRLPEHVAADTILPFEAQWHSTLRNDQDHAVTAVLAEHIGTRGKPRHVGVEFSSFGQHLDSAMAAELTDIEPLLYRLRRRKDADELRLMQKAIDATRAMYDHARRAIEPGINELDLYSQLSAVCVAELGEPPTYFGQDFQCNSRGGPPRNRNAERGEIYILDLGAGFRGYFSDNSRAFSVGRSPTAAQLRAWEQIGKVFAMVESQVRPGVSCKSIFEQAQTILDECRPWEFNHHLGHGVGLYPHEAPHLNPFWDDTFAVGDVFTAEPGLYHDELRHGMRLEQNYLVTENGVKLLTEFSLEL